MRKILLISIFTSACFAQTGTLDLSFDTDGKVTTAIGPGADVIYDIALQADGKIVAVGYAENGTDDDMAIARYNLDGSLDLTFNSTGFDMIDFGYGDDAAYGVAIQADGKIVIAGMASNASNSDYALVRYNTDGSLDNTFDSDGMVTTDFYTNYDMAYDIAIQADGKIVAGGAAFNDSIYNFSVARYNTNGSLDGTFGTGGKVTTILTNNDEGSAIAIQADGKIVLVGKSLQPDFYNAFGVARYNTDGSLDNTFNSTGKVITAVSPYSDEAQAVTIQTDGKIVAGGKATPVGPLQFAIVRYNTDGSLDNSWNSTGKVTTAFGSTWDEVRDILVQPDGKILAGGMATISGQRFAMALYNSDGSLSTGFGSGGKVTTTIGSSSSIWSLAWTTDDKIIGAGYSGSSDFALARYGENETKGIGELSLLGSLNVYPNPAKDKVMLSYELMKEENISITLMGMDGQMICTFVNQELQTPGSHQLEIILPEYLSAGNYFIVVSSPRGSTQSKLMKY